MKTTKIWPLPWHHFYFNSSGRIKACCSADKSVAPINEDTKNVTEFINENRKGEEFKSLRQLQLLVPFSYLLFGVKCAFNQYPIYH